MSIKPYQITSKENQGRAMFYVKTMLLSDEVVNIVGGTMSAWTACKVAEGLQKFGYVTIEKIKTYTEIENNRRCVKLVFTVKKTANFLALYKEHEEKKQKMEEERKKREEENKKKAEEGKEEGKKEDDDDDDADDN